MERLMFMVGKSTVKKIDAIVKESSEQGQRFATRGDFLRWAVEQALKQVSA